MKLSPRDVGKRFVAPSGREVELRAVTYVFVYVDDPYDGMTLSSEGLMILEPVRLTEKVERKLEAV